MISISICIICIFITCIVCICIIYIICFLYYLYLYALYSLYYSCYLYYLHCPLVHQESGDGGKKVRRLRPRAQKSLPDDQQKPSLLSSLTGGSETPGINERD